MNLSTFKNLAGAINYRFPDTHQFWEVLRNHLGIFLTKWDELQLGPEPDEATMLQWVQEFEALSDYERLSLAGKDYEDVRLEFIDRPVLKQLLKADRQTISDSIDTMTTQQLKELLKVLVVTVRMLVRQSLGD